MRGEFAVADAPDTKEARPSESSLPIAMVLAHQDAWRSHPFISNCAKKPFTGLGLASAIFGVYLVVDTITTRFVARQGGRRAPGDGLRAARQVPVRAQRDRRGPGAQVIRHASILSRFADAEDAALRSFISRVTRGIQQDFIGSK